MQQIVEILGLDVAQIAAIIKFAAVLATIIIILIVSTILAKILYGEDKNAKLRTGMHQAVQKGKNSKK